MGYSTHFTGELKFTREPTAKELAFVNSLFWVKDDEIAPRDLKHTKREISYVQFELTKAYDGIQWDGSEKFYKPVEAVNFIIENLRDRFPGLGLTGTLKAQGEERDDRWLLVVGEDGWAKRVEQPVTGTKVECPHCRETFFLEDAA